MYYFCTYFDQFYLPRGLALYRSLKEHCPNFRLWVLCMDEQTYEILSQINLGEVELIQLEDFEAGDKALLAAKQNRSKIEYYFTCTPSLPRYVLNHWEYVDLITYLDADLFFYADPKPLYEEIAEYSIAIIEHRYLSEQRHLECRGIYNVGWLSFRRDENGLACLQWWRERCIEWCYDRVEEERYADQKYLDQWPNNFQKVCILQYKGANVAPWNLANYQVTMDTDGCIFMDNDTLIFFHFHGFLKVNRFLYKSNLTGYKVRPTQKIVDGIFRPYIQILSTIHKDYEYLLAQKQLSNGIRKRYTFSFKNYSVQNLTRFLKNIFLGNYIWMR